MKRSLVVVCLLAIGMFGLASGGANAQSAEPEHNKVVADAVADATEINASPASVRTAAGKSAGWTVSVTEAETAAKRLVDLRSAAKLGQFAVWKDAKVGEPTEYVGYDGELAAYCFSVEKGKTDVGYVIVSASRLEMPIQEYSCSVPPHTNANLEVCKKTAKDAAGEGRELGVLRNAYLAPGLYAVEYPVLDKGVSAGGVFVDVVTSQVVKEATSAAKQEPSVSRTTKAGPAWLAITDSGKSTTVGAKVRPEFKYVINVPLMIRRTDLGSTAWAEVLNYWGVRKPREIPDLIAQQLAKSGVGGDSLQSFAKERGCSLKLVTRQRDAASPDSRASFTDVRIETDSGRPFVVTAADGKSASSALAGAGYAADEMGQWLIVHTGRSPTEASVQTDQSSPWCRPGVVFVNWDCAVDSLSITTVQVTREAQKIAE